MVEAAHISLKIGYRYLLQDVSWKIREGERWVVFGMNGSGKTTLLNIIAGFQYYTEGELKVYGERLSNDNILAKRSKIGWISSSFFDKHYSRESALDIVLSGKSGTLGLWQDVTLAERREAKQLLQELGLGAQAGHGFDMMSKGERQNVLIARALFAKPRMLVLDEPCTGLDIYNRAYLFDVIAKLAQERSITLVYVTHYAEEIYPDIFDKCLLLRKGRVFAQGQTRELFQDEMISELLGYPVAIRNEDGGRIALDMLNVSSNLTMFV